MLLEEHRLDINSDYLHPENDLGFTAIENDINRFISNVMTTMKTHEDSETYDFLTGLPMRSRGEKLVSQFMQKYDGCLVFIDMDNLKQINDTHGHKAGDRSLKLLGKLLSDMTPDAVVCRLAVMNFCSLCQMPLRQQSQHRFTLYSINSMQPRLRISKSAVLLCQQVCA